MASRADSYINIKDYGAVGNGIHDDTAAIQAAIDRVAVTYAVSPDLYLNGPFGAAIYFPPGTYLVTDTLNIVDAQTRFMGAGEQCAFILFYPSMDNGDGNVLFNFSKGSDSLLQNCAIKDLSIQSTDTTMVKTAILISDVEIMQIENVTISPWGDGNTLDQSIGLHILGRDLTTIRNVSIVCNRPIVVSPTGYTYNSSMDQIHFSDLYLHCSDPTGINIHFEPTVSISQVTFDGFQSWCGGYWGLYWNIDDGLIPDLQYNIQTLIVKGVRVELNLQNDLLCPSYGLYLNGPAQNVLIEAFQVSTATNGYHFEKTANLTMINCGYGWLYMGTGENPPSAEKVALHLHDDCNKVVLTNFDVQSPGITETGTLVKDIDVPGILTTYRQPE